MGEREVVVSNGTTGLIGKVTACYLAIFGRNLRMIKEYFSARYRGLLYRVGLAGFSRVNRLSVTVGLGLGFMFRVIIVPMAPTDRRICH